jgi:hypothetical protein
MKKTILLAVCALFIGAAAFAQSEDKKPTKEETIKWLTEKLTEWSKFKHDSEIFNWKCKITACEITISYSWQLSNNLGEGWKKNAAGAVERITIIYPTDFKEIESDGDIVYSESSITWTADQRENGTMKPQNWHFLDISTPATMIKRIEKAIRYLNSLCEDELREQGEPF